jgi:hypothetical protein
MQMPPFAGSLDKYTSDGAEYVFSNIWELFDILFNYSLLRHCTGSHARSRLNNPQDSCFSIFGRK